ncbi:MAG TPA: exopolysaccharide biosynthesis polyprenyl glycosylphosphotransferase [Gemmatimonadales bacterium]|nr:exopolysaccharide biosynthesis polyprenyl glycosylphosphotransferase [Gemmatimonadales bacterium]
METVPREVGAQVASTGAVEAPPPARIAFTPSYTPVEPATTDRFTPVQLRLGLQRRAAANLRRHMVRAVRRFAVLVVADLASFYVMRELVRAVRELPWFAAELDHALPRGILNGWQYAVALFVALFVTGNYGRGDQRRDPRRLFLACALATALPLWMTIWMRGLEPVMVQYTITTVLVWAGLVAERMAIDKVVEGIQPRYRNAAATLFVGAAEQCREAIESPGFAIGGECRPVGFVDVHSPPAPDALGQIADFRSLLDRAGAEVVVICGYLTDVRFREVVDASLAAESQVLSIPRSNTVAGVQPNLVWRRGQPLIELTAPSLKAWQVSVKRVIDAIGSAVGLVVLSPLFALVAAAVKLESAGPVFFTQVRVGRGGRRFRIIKFRTMVDGAEKRRDELLSHSVYSDARLFKVPNDPRMTRLGRWLRRTSIDELPQLFNVLRGEMSLVGPRPPLPSEVEFYEEHHYARFDVKPGITGPWQVEGRNQVTDFEQVVSLETEYIREWSLLSDLMILVRTVWVVAQMRGAH